MLIAACGFHEFENAETQRTFSFYWNQGKLLSRWEGNDRSNAEKAEARSHETKFWDCSSCASSVAPREWLLFATNLH